MAKPPLRGDDVFAWTDWALTAELAFTVVPVVETVKRLQRRAADPDGVPAPA
jgi:hypothetical protein